MKYFTRAPWSSPVKTSPFQGGNRGPIPLERSFNSPIWRRSQVVDTGLRYPLPPIESGRRLSF